jgi:ribosomal-protein-serine acetyltransferase
MSFPLKTRRLVIRPLQKGDEKALHAAVMESVPELSPWMPWAHKGYTLADAKAFVTKSAKAVAGKTDCPLAFLTPDGTFVGTGGLHTRQDPKGTVPTFEIGYWCRTGCAGQGYTTEFVKAVTAYAFKHLKARRVEIHCDARNTGSERVMAKAGFTKEAHLRKNTRDNKGRLRDTLIYAKVR